MSQPTEPEVRCRPVTPQRWGDLESFFGPRGAYGQCWCTYFRQRSADFDAGCRDDGAGNRALLHRITVEEARVPGLLAYDGDTPVGWVSVAPRPDFPRILRSPVLRPGQGDDPDDPSVWSVVCFWMPRRYRGRGVATRLLDAAVEHAAAGGARVVEAYPVDTAGERRSTAALYTGVVTMFERRGFTIARPAGSRVVVRRTL